MEEREMSSELAGSPLSCPPLEFTPTSQGLTVSTWGLSWALQFSFLALLLELPSAFRAFSEDLYWDSHISYLQSYGNCPLTSLLLHFQNFLDNYYHVKFNMFRTELIIIN